MEPRLNRAFSSAKPNTQRGRSPRSPDPFSTRAAAVSLHACMHACTPRLTEHEAHEAHEQSFDSPQGTPRLLHTQRQIRPQVSSEESPLRSEFLPGDAALLSDRAARRTLW